MTGRSYHCIAMLSEARRLHADRKYGECLRIIESVRSCTTKCGDEAVCTLALRLAGPMVEELTPVG